MEFPIEIQRLINEYAKPMTRVDWRNGSYISQDSSCNNHIKYIANEYLANVLINEMTNGLYMDKLIPDGRLPFVKFPTEYEVMMADEVEWW